MTKKNNWQGIQLDEQVTASELINICVKAIQKGGSDVYVTLRQCDGTDFPPFISFENTKIGNELEEDGYICLI